MREGARVVVGDVDRAGLDRVDTELGDAVATVECDVTSEPDVERMAATAIQRFGRLDVAFANAGIGTSTLITDADLEQWRSVVDMCLVGPFLTIKHCAPLMRSGGSIVITTSLNAVQAGRGMERVLRGQGGRGDAGPGGGARARAGRHPREHGRGRIGAHASSPPACGTCPPIVEDYVDNTPLGRYAAPDDIANVVAFLASDEANFVSGAQVPGRRGRRDEALPRTSSRSCTTRALTTPG